MCRQESNCTHETMENCDKFAIGPRQPPQHDAAAKAGAIWEPAHCCSNYSWSMKDTFHSSDRDQESCVVIGGGVAQHTHFETHHMFPLSKLSPELFDALSFSQHYCEQVV